MNKEKCAVLNILITLVLGYAAIIEKHLRAVMSKISKIQNL